MMMMMGWRSIALRHGHLVWDHHGGLARLKRV